MVVFLSLLPGKLQLPNLTAHKHIQNCFVVFRTEVNNENGG